MGLSEQQCALARLLTDADLRARFATDLNEVERELALSPDDTTQLSALVMPDVERSARSLHAKRWNEVEKRLPLSACAAHQRHLPLRREFLQFAQTYVPQGSKRHAQDAIAFADWCAQRPAGQFSEAESPVAAPAWLPDLMRYEAAWLSVALETRPRFVVLRRFGFPIHRIARAIAQSPREPLASNVVSARFSLAVWSRLSADGMTRHLVLPGRQD
jgi:hypothetical protein